MRIFHILFHLILISLITSCSTLRKKGTWGKNALWPIKGERILAALKRNVISPHVWVPLAGAGAIHWGGYDHKVSNWANYERTIFDDQTAGDNWSDNFNNILKYEMYLTTILTPSVDEDHSVSQYLLSKARGGVVVSLSSTSTRWTRNRIAKAVHRTRPNKADNKSFPSGHATEASSRRMIVAKNLDAIEMNSGLRTGVNVVNTTMSVGTLWARIEGKRHYPSDVLCGYALGSFLSGLIYDSLMNYDPGESFVVIPVGDKVSALYSLSF